MDEFWLAADSCTLPTVEQPLRAAEFDALFADNLVAVHPLGATRLQLVLDGPPGLASRVQDLTDRESECCSFFTFSLSLAHGLDDTRLHLDIEVPSERSDVLELVASRARTAVEPGPRA